MSLRRNPTPLGDQEAVGDDAERGVVMEAAPAAAFVMAKADLLFELVIVALDRGWAWVSSTMLSTRNRRPQANWSWTKSSDQRVLGRAATRIGARVPTARRRLRHLRTVSPSSR